MLLDLFHYVIFKPTLLFCLASNFIACHFIFSCFRFYRYCYDIVPVSTRSASNVMCMRFILSPSMSVLPPCIMLWTEIVPFCELKKTQPVFRVIWSLERNSIKDSTRIHHDGNDHHIIRREISQRKSQKKARKGTVKDCWQNLTVKPSI